MSHLFRRFYTLTFSVIFGIFLAMIPNILSDACVLGWNRLSLWSGLLLAAGFCLSFYLGDMKAHNARLRIVIGKSHRIRGAR